MQHLTWRLIGRIMVTQLVVLMLALLWFGAIMLVLSLVGVVEVGWSKVETMDTQLEKGSGASRGQ